MENLEHIDDLYEDPLKTELIDGAEYAMAAGSLKHAEAIANLNAQLYAFFAQKPCKPYSSELEIHMDGNRFRPDISVICDYSKAKGNGYEGAPDLIVEVLSPRTAHWDYGKKFTCYQNNGVKEYWIVNPDYHTIEQYALAGGRFQLIAVHLSAAQGNAETDLGNPHKYSVSFRSYAFEELEVNVLDVFNYRMG